MNSIPDLNTVLTNPYAAQAFNFLTDTLHIPTAEIHRFFSLFKSVANDAQRAPLLGEEKLVWLTRGARMSQLTIPVIKTALTKVIQAADVIERGIEAKVKAAEEAAVARGIAIPYTPADRKKLVDFLVALSKDAKGMNEKLLQAIEKAPEAIDERIPFIIDTLTNFITDLMTVIKKQQSALTDIATEKFPEYAFQLMFLLPMAEVYMTMIEQNAGSVGEVAKSVLAPSASASASAAAPAPESEAVKFVRSFFDLLRRLPALRNEAPKANPYNFEPMKELEDITLKDIDLSYAELEAMAATCTKLKKFTLGENVTLNGSKFFDKEMVVIFFKDIEIAGCPCDATKGRLQELLDATDALSLTKAQMWNFAVELHKEAHANAPHLHTAEDHATRVQPQVAALEASVKSALSNFQGE